MEKALVGKSKTGHDCGEVRGPWDGPKEFSFEMTVNLSFLFSCSLELGASGCVHLLSGILFKAP